MNKTFLIKCCITFHVENLLKRNNYIMNVLYILYRYSILKQIHRETLLYFDQA